MNDFDQFERRLGAALRSDADASVGPFEPGSIVRAAVAGSPRRPMRLPRASSRLARRFGRGRGITLLAAAALLLVGGALAAGSGRLRLPSIVPPLPAPSFGAVATASSDATSPSPSESPGPSAGPTASAVTSLTGVWIPTGSMATPRGGHTAVRLLDGRVLVAGGSGVDNETSAELYDPDSGTWSATGNMVHPHGFGFPATLLRDGRVLVGDVTDGDTDHPSYGAELYDPATGTWSSTGSQAAELGFRPTATLLTNGKVLVAGSQLYDPDSGTWTATGKMVTPRFNHTATLLPDGRVLVAGGEFRTVKAELYDPDTGLWTATADMRESHQLHDGDGPIATLLDDGTVLVMGRGTAELYDPATGTWTATRERSKLDKPYAATRLLDGTVLMAGPPAEPDVPNGAELYDPTTGSWTKTGSMLYPPSSATLLLDGTVLVAGGHLRRRHEFSGAVRPCRRVGASRGGSPSDSDSDPGPDTDPRPDTDADPVPARGGSRPAGRTDLAGNRRQQEFQTRDVVPGRGGRERHRAAVRVGDPQCRASRRHREGDLPTPPEGGDELLDLGEPGSGPGGIVVPDVRRTPGGQDPHPEKGRAGGLVEPIGDVRSVRGSA